MADEETKPLESEENQSAPTAAAESETAPAAEAPETAQAEVPQSESESAPEASESTQSDAAEAPKKEEEKKRDIFAELLGEEPADKIKIHKAKSNKNVTSGVVHILATFNNTVVTVTDRKGNSIGWSSAGKMGFKGSRKSTAYAAQVVSQDACRQAMGHGLKEVEVRVKGPGSGRESAVRAVQNIGLDITTILDVTSIPHNGCRPKKARRV